LTTVTQVTAGFMYTTGANMLCWKLYAGRGSKINYKHSFCLMVEASNHVYVLPQT